MKVDDLLLGERKIVLVLGESTMGEFKGGRVQWFQALGGSFTNSPQSLIPGSILPKVCLNPRK